MTLSLKHSLKTHPLQEAYKIGQRSHKQKFDWENIEDVIAKVDEELIEVKNAKGYDELLHEIGDLLFATVQLARHCKVNPVKALDVANKRFNQRYFKMIEISGLTARQFNTLPLSEKEAYWQKVKKILAKKS